jgi:hypothetical protein
MNFRGAMAILSVSLAFAAVSARAQATIQRGDPPATPPPSASAGFAASTTLVLVPALVRTRSGELVFTLKADDFILTDNGVEQKLSLEDDTDGQPLALVVAVETGGAGARQLDKLSHVGSLIEALVGNVRHRVAVVAFDSQPRLVEDFTPRMNIANSIEGLTPGDHGAAVLDGLSYSVGLLRDQPPEFRCAVRSSAKPSTAAATSSSTRPCAPSATPTPSSTAWAFPRLSLRCGTTPQKSFRRYGMAAASRILILSIPADAWRKIPTPIPAHLKINCRRHMTASVSWRLRWQS